jgi:hypothetical protein
MMVVFIYMIGIETREPLKWVKKEEKYYRELSTFKVVNIVLILTRKTSIDLSFASMIVYYIGL